MRYTMTLSKETDFDADVLKKVIKTPDGRLMEATVDVPDDVKPETVDLYLMPLYLSVKEAFFPVQAEIDAREKRWKDGNAR